MLRSKIVFSKLEILEIIIMCALPQVTPGPGGLEPNKFLSRTFKEGEGLHVFFSTYFSVSLQVKTTCFQLSAVSFDKERLRYNCNNFG